MKIVRHTRSVKRHFILCVVLLCGLCSGFAQTYPVYVTPSLMPPYSLKLSDYSTMGSQQLVVTIMVNDATVSNLPVKLHIKIEGSGGVAIETLPTLTTLPVYLNGGQTTLLFGADLADYFKLDNLVFTGYNKEQYRRTGYLPEGFYKFTVELLHYGTNRLISNRGVATAWMALGKPPVLRSPDEGAELGQVAGMPLTFSWLPSNVGVPSAGVHYTFELWELRIPGINPNVIAASMPAFHTMQQAHTTLVVQPAELFLEQGMRYAWRVTAFDPMGKVPFEQDGHSEVRTFTYQARCDTVVNFIVERQAARGTFRWNAGVNHTSFNVEMRNPATAYFHQSQTFDNKVTYPSLDFGTAYQLRVQAVCNGDPQHVSAFSSWHTLTIPELQPDTTSCPDCRCSGSPSSPPVTNFTLRKDLQPGDVISNAAGSTRFILKSVTPQADGVYKGLFWFWAEIWHLKILCEYWDLSVNTDNVMVKVDYKSVFNPQFLLDVDAAKDFVDSLANAIAEVITKDTLKFDTPIESVYVNNNGDIVIVKINPDGTTSETILEYDRGKEKISMLIEDNEGNIYEVDVDERGINIAREAGSANYTEHKRDSTISEEKIEAFKNRIISELIRDIKTIDIVDYTGKEKEYIAGAISNVEYLNNTVIESESYFGATGWYKDGKLFVKYTGNENDVKVTLFHEYLHHINYLYKMYEYRYENENKREIYTIKDTCFFYKEATMDYVYELFLISNIAISSSDWAFKYADLTPEQKQQVIEYKNKNKEWFEDKQCFSGYYQPSNYYRDEIMVREVCFKLNNIIFNMTEEKILRYKEDIETYKRSVSGAEEYEFKKHLNEKGYEK